ncbi:hypothetical protein SMICM17S_05890 [Streptomyces microflavus]
MAKCGLVGGGISLGGGWAQPGDGGGSARGVHNGPHGFHGSAPHRPPAPPLTVGFDLDMTLIDSRPGIAAAYRALSAETGVRIDDALVVSRGSARRWRRSWPIGSRPPRWPRPATATGSSTPTTR